MDHKEVFEIALKISTNNIISTEVYEKLADLPLKDVYKLLPGADLLRSKYFGNEIHLCTICNGKSGKCSEDCTFCSQSSYAKTEAPVYPLLGVDELQKGALDAEKTPLNRYSVVTSGRGLPSNEIAIVAEAFDTLKRGGVNYCASLGIISQDEFTLLKKSGVGRYHHNLETSRTHFDKICTTHTYDERIQTIRDAQGAGLTICSGGIFGMGESDRQVLEMALTLKELDVDAVPLNFLVPVKGTKLEGLYDLTPLRCLKIIALFRYVMPDKDIIICGGREPNLKDLQAMIFNAGANGIMTGNYLTTDGRTLEQDLAMIENAGFVPKPKN